MAFPTYLELKEDVASSGAVSFWLKKALKEADTRDCVDALYDAKTLVFILQQKVTEATGASIYRLNAKN